MYNEETGMYEGYIYQIYNPFNMKSYIGQTIVTIHKRFIKHKTTSRKHPSHSIYLYTDARDYGWDIFDVREIEKICRKSKEELVSVLNEKEIYYIKEYNALYPNGYNIAKGGNVLPNTYDECVVYKFDLDKNLICSYDSMSEAARINNISQADISNCCNGKRVVTVGGFYWSKSPVLTISNNVKRRNTCVVAYGLDCKMIKVFDSQKDGAIELYGDKKFNYHISNSLRSGRAACGYVWKYYDDVIDSHGNVLNILPENMAYRVNYKRHWHPDRSKMVGKYSLQDELLECFKSITIASEVTGINRSCISDCINNRQQTAGGFIWRAIDKE